MTAINSMLTPTGVAVFSDTLMTLENGRPVALVTKVYPVPQINALISGRGTSDLIFGWACDVTGRWLTIDFDSLVATTQDELVRRWAQLEGCRAESTTVFMWGWSPAQSRFLGYAFRAGNGFVPEPLDDGRLCAPGVEDMDRYKAIMAQENELDALLDVMLLAAEEGRANPDISDRCHIGGEVLSHIMRLEDDGRITTTSQIVHVFKDRESDLFKATMLRLLG